MLDIPSEPNNTTPNPVEQIKNGLSVLFECDPGYNIQGSNMLKCLDGNWSSDVMPECLPMPCVLPEAYGATYQGTSYEFEIFEGINETKPPFAGGYRAGLSVAHGSHVIIQCDKSQENPAPSPIQVDYALGTLTSGQSILSWLNFNYLKFYRFLNRCFFNRCHASNHQLQLQTARR